MKTCSTPLCVHKHVHSNFPNVFSTSLNRDIPKEKLVVRCGEGDDIEDEHSRHQDRFALSEPVRHPDYTLTSQKIPEYDFALIKVDRPFELNINVDTMCMPTSHNDYDPNDCYATGFGKDRWGKLIQKER